MPLQTILAHHAGRSQDALGWVERNEAFAPSLRPTQSLVVIQSLGLNPERINPLGGAIALGASGGAIRTVAIFERIEGCTQGCHENEPRSTGPGEQGPQPAC